MEPRRARTATSNRMYSSSDMSCSAEDISLDGAALLGVTKETYREDHYQSPPWSAKANKRSHRFRRFLMTSRGALLLLLALGCAVVLVCESQSDSGKRIGTIISSSMGYSASATPRTSRRPRRPVAIKSHLELLKKDATFLEAWVARGEILPGLDLSAHTRMDGFWTWVNGSDPRHIASRELLERQPSAYLGPEGGHKAVLPASTDPDVDNRLLRFRERDELRYSMRSTKAALGDYLRTAHLLTSDYWAKDTDALSGQIDTITVEKGLRRSGQIPQWLDIESAAVRVGDAATVVQGAEEPSMRVQHHWNFFGWLSNVGPVSQAWARSEETEDDAIARKGQILPTFNSIAIEAMIPLEATDLADIFLYSNDDFFLGQRMTTADFGSPLYGPVLRFERWMYNVAEEEPLNHGGAEDEPLEYSSWLLDRRFGARGRIYPTHVTKTHLQPLVTESRMMWGADFDRASSERFRTHGKTISHHLLSYHFIMERHREALLWSYLVAALDKNADGHYQRDELCSEWQFFGFACTSESDEHGIWELGQKPVLLPTRDSADDAVVKNRLQSSQFPYPLSTSLAHTSLDGTAYAQLEFPDSRADLFPPFHKGHPNDTVATQIDWAECWPQTIGSNPLLLFQRMAFIQPSCGDALITLLVGQSGKRGLSAFLPQEDLMMPHVASAVDKDQTTPHLPLNDRWTDADFSLAAVARNTGWSAEARRTFCMMLIQRYTYSVGLTPFSFTSLESAQAAHDLFAHFRAEASSHNVKGDQAYGFIAINDGFDGDNGAADAGLAMKAWMQEAWPEPMDIERSDSI